MKISNSPVSLTRSERSGSFSIRGHIKKMAGEIAARPQGCEGMDAGAFSAGFAICGLTED